MAGEQKKVAVFSSLSRFRIRRVIYIAFFWTIIDIVASLLLDYLADHTLVSLFVRECLVFVMSLIMGYLFVFTLKHVFRNDALWKNFLAKSFILLVAAFVMNFFVHFVENKFIAGFSVRESLHIFFTEKMLPSWILRRMIYWLVIFMVTQLYLEINDKYSPGVFLDILFGKYIKPKDENRIVMFIDLKDSTPIAEKLGHYNYFLFIREFIYHVSMALIESGGIIYQYVGDEIVVSWVSSPKHAKKAMKAIIAANKNIQKNSTRFRRIHGIIPEFHVGIHIGDVTVGEIGVIKKDLAMSGDTMNTAARICSACKDLSRKYLVSKDFVACTSLQDHQLESLGIVELKGKSSGVELFSLNI
ncbi:MAG: adenylate/guanylate cyclase domain-containing protein [Ferruginibacter sp.]